MTEELLQMTPAKPLRMEVDARYIDQNARLAIQDIYDALVELITNADDRYEVLRRAGEIHIEVERRRKGEPSVIRVRDFADGMTSTDMREKLSRLGGRVSGMADGQNVRGTNSRGAKDVAALGSVTFESIAEDANYHKCEIPRPSEFIPYAPSVKATARTRRALKIPTDTGTVVTIMVEPTRNIPRHDTLKKGLQSLVALRDMLRTKDRRIVLRDLTQRREDPIEPLHLEGKDLVKERFTVPGYPRAEAKLVIKRSRKRFEDRRAKFRPGGILVKSRHAVHEATYFDANLENDPHAQWFFGKLRCEYIDEISNEYDERQARRLPPTKENPSPLVDPLRKAGLRREHPFTQALFREALKRFRPLVEAERKREEKERVNIESEQTRKRLNKLERAAARFMQEHLTESDTVREPDSRETDSTFLEKGFSLCPPFAQVLQRHSCRFWLNIRQESFPELSVGDSVEINCLTDEITLNKRYAQLEVHPTQEGVIRCIWLVKGVRPTKGTGIQVRVGPIVADSLIEVLESERDKYADINSLSFNRKQYTVVVGKPKTIQILAPYPSVVTERAPLDIKCSHSAFSMTGDRVLVAKRDCGIALCKLRIDADRPDCPGTLLATVNGHTASAKVISTLPTGAPIKISIEPEHFGNQRYRWKANVLQIAGKHAAIRRYLGPAPEFPGQEGKPFRVVLAEIVAEAVCQRVLSKMEIESPEEYRDLDWNAFYAEYTKLMSEFLPTTHALQVPDPY